MGRINVGRVIVGGLLAGLVINVGETVAALLFARQAEEIMASLGLTTPGGAAMGVFVVVGFVMGVVLIWLYAAIRPRLGAGPRSAVIVGLVVWFLGYLLPLLGDLLMGLLPLGMVVKASAWGLVEVCVAALAGAWLYKEQEATG